MIISCFLRNITLQSNGTDGVVLLRGNDIANTNYTLILGEQNTHFLKGFTSIYIDFHTVINTVMGRGFLMNYTAGLYLPLSTYSVSPYDPYVLRCQDDM